MKTSYKYLVRLDEVASNQSSYLKSEFVRSFQTKEEMDSFEDLLKNFIISLQELNPGVEFDKHIIIEEIEV